MLTVLRNSWALLLGMLLLMIGNGLQGTLVGVRGAIEGFSTFNLSLITSAYFLGFLGGSRLAPEMIRRVGHVRVFAALGSFVSAALILYPAITHPGAWVILRIVIGFCFSGLYVTAEAWLNNSTSNDTRGQALSAYMMVQMTGIVSAQMLLNVADPAGFLLFIIPSVLVSISFAPILLSIAPTPAFDNTKDMSLRQLYGYSPLGFVGMFLLGSVFSAQFGMSAVYATQVGLSVGQISIFVAAIFVGALVLQYPIGYISDRMDRRKLIAIVSFIGAGGSAIGWLFGPSYEALLFAAFIIGGMANPLYALLIAYTNDYLEPENMAAASAGLLFVNGLGAVMGPIVVGWAMTSYGAGSFWAAIFVLMLASGVYAVYRMTRRMSAYADEGDYEAVPYAPIGLGTSPVVAELAQDVYVDAAEEIAEDAAEDAAGDMAAPEQKQSP